MDNATPHTPEPWEVGVSVSNMGLAEIVAKRKGRKARIGSVEGNDRAHNAGHPIPPEEALANARRIVACVNICDGISVEDLERKGKVADGLSRIDEMVAAAEEAAAYLAMRDESHGDFGAADKATRLRAAIAAMREMRQP